MFTATAPSLRATATAFAASMLGTALVFAVPQAAHAAPKSDFVRTVEAQINGESYSPSWATGVATVAVRIDADGKVLSTGIAGSTGHAMLDRQALRTAKSVTYPKGSRARTVAVVLTFGKVSKPAAAQSAALVNRYVNAKGEALASQSPATPVG